MRAGPRHAALAHQRGASYLQIDSKTCVWRMSISLNILSDPRIAHVSGIDMDDDLGHGLTVRDVCFDGECWWKSGPSPHLSRTRRQDRDDLMHRVIATAVEGALRPIMQGLKRLHTNTKPS